jgi:TolB protein
VYLALGALGGFQPAQGPWLETPLSAAEASVEIWVMNADGTGQTRLIEAAEGWQVQMPAWSPDGSQIAYVRVRTPERAIQSDDMDVWLASADGTDRRLLVGGVGWQWLPHWSPDGAWIVYTVDPPGGPGQGAGLNAPAFGFGQGPAFGQPPTVSPEVDVWRVRADGSVTPERLTDAPSDDRAGAYSPDGRHILFDSTRAEGRTGVYVMDTDGANVVRVTFQGDDWGASWSPDGARIAFHSSPTGDPADIYVTTYPPTGSAPLRLTDDPDNDLAPNWSRDGSRIAFQSWRDDLLEIWSMAADGSDLRNLTRTPGDLESLTLGGEAWGPDGRILYGRVPPGPAWTDPLVRQNLGVATMLLEAIFLVLVVVLVVRIAPPFGAVAVIMSFGAAFAAVDADDWRFLPAAIVGGLVIDFLIRLAPAHRRTQVAGAGSAAALVLGAGATVILTAGLGWTPSLLLGVALACSVIGWGLGGLIGRSIPVEAQAVGE